MEWESDSEKRQQMIREKSEEICKLLVSTGWKDRARGEYLFIKEKTENLKNMLITRIAGNLDFTPNCSIELLTEQLNAMTAYLNILELRSHIEGF